MDLTRKRKTVVQGSGGKTCTMGNTQMLLCLPFEAYNSVRAVTMHSNTISIVSPSYFHGLFNRMSAELPSHCFALSAASGWY